MYYMGYQIPLREGASHCKVYTVWVVGLMGPKNQVSIHKLGLPARDLDLDLDLDLEPQGNGTPWAMVHLSHQSQGTTSQQILDPLGLEYTHRAKVHLSHQILHRSLGSRYTLLIKYTAPKATVHLTQQILTQLSPPTPKYSLLISYTHLRAMVNLTQQLFDLRHTLLSKS